MTAVAGDYGTATGGTAVSGIGGSSENLRYGMAIADADGGDVNRDLLEIHDGPLTRALQDTDGKRIASPPATVHRPNLEFLAFRFEQFRKAA